MSSIKTLFGIIIGLAVLTATVAEGRPIVIITFDDGWRSVLDNAFPIMQGNNQAGVAFIIANQPDLPWNGLPDNYMNRTQLQQLYDAGWDISSHTYSHVNLTTVNSTTLNNELNMSYDWLNTNGYRRSAMFLAYPEGSYNANVIAAVQANHYAAARTIDPPDSNYPNYNLTSPDVYTLKAYETIGGTDNDITVINQINNTIAANGLLILAFHKIVDNLSANESEVDTEFKTTDFRNVSNYLQSRSSEVDVRTLSDYFGVTPLPTPSPTPTPTYMPPTPINTTLDESKNLTWAAGVGNVTDYFNYNINGTWYNESNTTFYDLTGLGPGTYTVKVYAVNSTNGRTVNSTPLILDGIVSATPTPTSSPAVVGDSSGSNSGSSSGGSSGGSSRGSSGGNSGGGGGGGGGESGEDFSNVVMKEKYDRDIYVNKVTEYALTYPDNPIRYVNITGNVNAGETTTIVEVLRNTSSFANYSAPGTVYENVNIWVGILGFAVPRNIKEAVITFRVENSWISSNNIKNNSIKMVRWDGGKWNLLETSEKTKDDKYTYFEAKTNAFSPFAITEMEDEVASSIIPSVTQSGVTGTGVTGATVPNSTITGEAPSEEAPSINFAIIIAIFAMIGIVIAIHLKRRGNF